jgi:transposase
MYLRKNNRFKDGKNHIYWTLCETIRTGAGPRQRIVSYLREINGTDEKRWQKTIKVCNEAGQVRPLCLFAEDVEIRERVEEEKDVDIIRIKKSRVSWERPREFGQEYVLWKIWEKLGLDKFCEERLDQTPGDVRWSKIAAILAINRVVSPGSELQIEEEWYQKTALDDIAGISADKINTDRLYRCLDLIIAHKESLEKHLKEKYGELFDIKYNILLYDITSTYFEGESALNPRAQRGYSRDQRPDCKQVCIALIVSEEGFPFAYEIFDGNRSDATTLEEVIKQIEKKYGKSQRVWIFDRGIVSEENLAFLRRRQGQYLVGSRRSELKKYEQELLDKNWQKVREEVEVKLIPAGNNNETYVLCRARGRQEKEKAMREKASVKLEKQLTKLSKRIEKGKIKNEKKIERRIGALLGKYPAVSDLYEVEYKSGKLDWKIDDENMAWKKAREGAYLLRTNISEKDPVSLWEKYIQLTEIEAVFRVIKSELVIRPIWHYKEKRVAAHILVAFLGYALWVTLKHMLHSTAAKEEDTLSNRKALGILSGIKVGDIVLETVDQQQQIKLRRISNLEPEQKTLLSRLKIQLPRYGETNDLIQKCSGDFLT